MMNKLFLAAFFLLLSAWAQAEVTSEVERTIRQKISGTLKDIQVTRILESPVPGLYQVQLGVDVVYVTGDGRYLLRGELLDLEKKENQTRKVRRRLRSVEFAALTDEEYIEFAARRDSDRRVLYVFTDVRCSYCRRLHSNMAEINRLGITVRYLAFPVIGDQAEALELMDRVWCAEDRNKALTKAKLGNTRIASADCDSPVREQFRLGQEMGVSGTPAMYLENGTELPGYMEPGQILQQFRS